ncbi:hypothetical protein D9615_009307 [Tricholomella constricta]|uniref:Uncharacterized protein n=1 Tax=Tricholomella constricta TaxID=117010 RepID=A0A8H5LWW4_9AGAR|nr:hypothetical protein D9615_009307 [Tricholomella constricta]
MGSHSDPQSIASMKHRTWDPEFVHGDLFRSPDYDHAPLGHTEMGDGQWAQTLKVRDSTD